MRQQIANTLHDLWKKGLEPMPFIDLQPVCLGSSWQELPPSTQTEGALTSAAEFPIHDTLQLVFARQAA